MVGECDVDGLKGTFPSAPPASNGSLQLHCWHCNFQSCLSPKPVQFLPGCQKVCHMRPFKFCAPGFQASKGTCCESFEMRSVPIGPVRNHGSRGRYTRIRKCDDLGNHLVWSCRGKDQVVKRYHSRCWKANVLPAADEWGSRFENSCGLQWEGVSGLSFGVFSEFGVSNLLFWLAPILLCKMTASNKLEYPWEHHGVASGWLCQISDLRFSQWSFSDRDLWPDLSMLSGCKRFSSVSR